jgi:hypothetical protein
MADTNRSPSHRGLAVLLLLVTAGLAAAIDRPAAPTNPFAGRLLEIARTYPKYGRVDDLYRWAPHYCRVPPPAAARFSASDDTATHGQKLYSVFARQREPYANLGKAANPVGQVVVKESWVPEEVEGEKEPFKPVVRTVRLDEDEKGTAPVREVRDVFLPYARKGDKVYRAASQADLFIMFKVEPATPGTDKGWVYGTVTADGKRVTSCGRVATCMQCHQDAPHDRLFGLPKDTPPVRTANDLP